MGLIGLGRRSAIPKPHDRDFCHMPPPRRSHVGLPALGFLGGTDLRPKVQPARYSSTESRWYTRRVCAKSPSSRSVALPSPITTTLLYISSPPTPTSPPICHSDLSTVFLQFRPLQGLRRATRRCKRLPSAPTAPLKALETCLPAQLRSLAHGLLARHLCHPRATNAVATPCSVRSN